MSSKTKPLGLTQYKAEYKGKYRQELASLEGQRYSFYGLFEKFSGKGKGKTTLLVTNIVLVGETEILTDHIWFNLTKGFKKAKLIVGDVIRFDATVLSYSKGLYKRQDLKLKYPTNIFIEYNIYNASS
jgi:hypothetical protein